MPKRKKRGGYKKKKDDSPDDASECESLDRPPSAKKVAAASSTSQLEDEVEHISSFTSLPLFTSRKSGAASSHYLCNFCDFSAETKTVLVTHMRQHMIKCPHCCFSSLSRTEVYNHCKYEHERDMESVSQEVDSSSTDCEMDKDPCSACVFCSFMTYSTEHLEKHTAHKHPGMLTKSVAKMVTKQVSTEVRRDDALFYLAISSEGMAKSSVGLGYSASPAEDSSRPIVIDNAEDVKPEVRSSAETRPAYHTARQSDQHLDLIKLQGMTDVHCGISSGQLTKSRDRAPSVETTSSLSEPVKVETMYCLTCPYSSVYVEKLKCHTIVQHPVGAAAAAYNSSGESTNAEDITFFCVREDCSHSSSDCSSYGKHLMECCAYKKTLKVLERERLKSTITYILEHQRKHKLIAEDSFLDFASTFLGLSLPSSHKRISSPTIVDTHIFQQSRNEKPLNNLQTLLTNISDSTSETPTGTVNSSYVDSNRQQISSAISSSSHQLSDSSTVCYPQQPQCVGSNSHLPGNNLGSYHSQTHNAVAHMSNSTINLPTDRQLSQPTQILNSEPGNYGQNYVSYPQPTSAQLLVRSYNDKPQINVNWLPSNQKASVSSTSAPNQLEQNYRPAFQNQHSQGSTELVSQDSLSSTSFNQNNSHSFPMIQNMEVNSNFTPTVLQCTHTTTYRPGSFDSVSAQNVTSNISQGLTGVVNRMNTVTGHKFCEQQQAVSTVFSTTAADINNAEIQQQPKMLDLLSDSYNILLSDEFGSEGRGQEIMASSHSQPHLTPINPPSYHQEGPVNTQSLSVVSQLSTRTPQQQLAVSQQPAVPQQPVVPEQQSTVYQTMQPEGPVLKQSAVGVSVVQTCESQFSFPSSSDDVQITNIVTNLNPNSGFQATQSSSSYGALRNALSSEESSYVQTPPLQSSNVPNFLVSSSSPASEVAVVQQHVTSSSFLNAHSHTVESVAAPGGPSTPPRSVNSANKFTGASPLSPSIYLSGQVPRHRRSNWTVADMRPRGMASPAAPPRNIFPPTSALGPQNVSQRAMFHGRRGYPRAPRVMSARGRMPAPRMPHNAVGGGGDDDDVIVTAVTRVTPRLEHRSREHGRFPNRGAQNSVQRGRGQVLSTQNQQRGLISSGRVLHPVVPHPPLPLQPQKQFDISKHFEDLACVVNASAEEGEGGDDNDIEIVGVTPGKDKEKNNQPKAVDASKFSFCCVHCGKDQGSKNVMKQHMKARHNDSLLGAFTNIETGQLLFFCPQLTCEFMTYDEKRLSEHLSKCFDLDKSKPFDFGTAIKNLKSLKIRQLDVRTMGRSWDNPIDLDGQGMKDNFSSSLNDAFGDIVVSASGRHIIRPLIPPQRTQLPQVQPQSLPSASGATRGRLPLRNTTPASVGTRLRTPGLTERGGIVNRAVRPMTPLSHSRQQNVAWQTKPTGARMEVQNVRGMRPPVPASAVRHQTPAYGASPSNVNTPPRLPVGRQQDPIVIDLDADSPEQPQAAEQNDSIAAGVLDQISSCTSNTSARLENTVNQTRHTIQGPQVISTFATQGQHFTLASQDSFDSHQTSSCPQPQASASVSVSSSRADTSSTEASEPAQHTYDTSAEGIPAVPESATNESEIRQDCENISNSAAYTTDCSSATTGSAVKSAYIVEAAPHDPIITNPKCADLPSDRISTTDSTDTVPAPAHALADSSVAHSEIIQHSASNLDGASLPASNSAVSSAAPAKSHLNTPPTTEYFDEEEKIQAVVLEKVFAKVPNMPKNLSRRLVAKFKQYANYRGVKITTDSKVIDEFVSKIYYKGSAADKSLSKVQPISESSQTQNGGSRESSSTTSQPVSCLSDSLLSSNSVSAEESTANKVESECEPPRTLTVKSAQQNSEEEHNQVVKAAPEPESLNEVVTTKVNLQQQNVQDSGTVVSITSVAPSHLSETGQQQTLAANQVSEEKHNASLNLHIIKEQSMLSSRRNSASDSQISKRTCNAPPRSSSAPSHAYNVPAVHKAALSLDKNTDNKFEGEIAQKLTISTSLKTSFCNALLADSSGECGSEASISTMETVAQQKLIHCNKPYTKEGAVVVFPAALKPHITKPILITSSVDHIVSGHPVLEVGIAERPCREEYLAQDKELETEHVMANDKELDTECDMPKDKEFETGHDMANDKELETDCDKAKDKELQIEYEMATDKELETEYDMGQNKELTGHGMGQDKDLETEDVMVEETEHETEGGIEKKVTEREGGKDTLMEQCLGTKKAAAKNLSIIDRATGTLLLKKTKKGRPSKVMSAGKEKQEGSVDATEAEEHVIRRSLRCRKPVNKDYQTEANEIDALMSDDDDEYNIDEDDYDSDTDNEWPGNADQPPKKKVRRSVHTPDPTAFDSSTKGKFRCWQCKKIVSKCSFAKSHIVRKHPDAGLCTIYLDQSEESKTLCLLLFCPRLCKYATTSFEGINSHVESCTKPLLQDGEKYLEITKQFLHSKYSELQSMGLEAALNITKVRKPKDPSKALKPKKPKVKLSRSDVTPSVIIPHSEAVVLGAVDNAVISTVSSTLNTTPSSAPRARSFTSAFRPELKLKQTQQTSSSFIMAENRKPFLKTPSFSQEPNWHTVVSSHLSSPNSTPVAAPATYTAKPEQQILISEQSRASSSLPQHTVLPSAPRPHVLPDLDDDILYMIEENGTICLK